MKREIERKFLVPSVEFLKGAEVHNIHNMKQGYLCKDDGRIVRVRYVAVVPIIEETERAYLTIKLKGKEDSEAGVDEFEYLIPADEALKLLEHCQTPIIDKTRYYIKHDDLMWEVDMFHGHKEGLIVAEIELDDINQQVTLPTWVGEEVTGNPAYYNANM